MTSPSTNTSKYPSEEQLKEWWQAAIGQSTGNYSMAAFIARKACDWQREQDALICEGHVAHEYGCDACELLKDCASAIRHSPHPDKHEEG